MESRGINAADLSKRAGLGRTAVYDFLTGRSKSLRMASVSALAGALDVAVEQLTSSAPETSPFRPAPAEAPGRVDLPVYASAQGGEDGMVITMEPIEYLPRPDYLKSVPEAFAFYVVGDSMEPRYEQGERVLVHPKRPARAGSDVLLIFHTDDPSGVDHSAMVKRLVSVSRDVIRVRQYNPPREFDIERKTVANIFKIMGLQVSD